MVPWSLWYLKIEFKVSKLPLYLKSEIMDRVWSSRCLNNRLDMPDKIGLFLNDAMEFMVSKNGV